MKRIKQLTDYFLADNRQKRLFENYHEKYRKYEELSQEDLRTCYIKAKTDYTAHKNYYSVFIVTVLVSIFMGIGTKFYNLLIQLFQLLYKNDNSSRQLATVGLILTLGIGAFFVVGVVVSIIFYIKKLTRLYNEVLVIEEIQKQAQKKEN